MQNRTHIKWLSNYLKEDIPFYSIVAFSERCQLKKVSMSNSDIYVINRTRELEEMKARLEMLQSNMEKKICPRCGNGLVLRSAKKGQNAGQQFYGCSTFPKCRYIEK